MGVCARARVCAPCVYDCLAPFRPRIETARASGSGTAQYHFAHWCAANNTATRSDNRFVAGRNNKFEVRNKRRTTARTSDRTNNRLLPAKNTALCDRMWQPRGRQPRTRLSLMRRPKKTVVAYQFRVIAMRRINTSWFLV